MSQYKVYILSYKGSNIFENWFNPNSYLGGDTYILDNGNQIWDKFQNKIVYSTTRNIGCAGGWNIICDIAFNDPKIEKIIIGSDDATYSEENITKLYNLTTSECLPGTYSNGFHFGMFGIHRKIWEKVGRFDENFVNCSSEDFDYVYRCLKNGISNFENLNVDSRQNLNLVSSTIGEQVDENRKYLSQKWGNPTTSWLNGGKGEGLYEEIFDGEPYSKFVPKLIEVYPDITDNNLFPSEIEFLNYLKNFNGI